MQHRICPQLDAHLKLRKIKQSTEFPQGFGRFKKIFVAFNKHIAVLFVSNQPIGTKNLPFQNLGGMYVNYHKLTETWWQDI